MRVRVSLVIALLALTGCVTEDATQVVNVYSARHYDGDDPVFERFTAATGIEVRMLEDKADALIERMKAEGDSGPADVFITVDAGRLHQAQSEGVFAAVASTELDRKVPSHLRHPEGLWFGLTKRARVIAYSTERVATDEIERYEDLTDPRWRGRVLARSSSSVYNQSLVASLINAHGEEGAEAWCRGLVANFARTPQGGDRDQIRAIAAGVGDVAIVNSYYYAQMLDGSADDREAASKVALLFPNQDDRGAHVNLSGIGVVNGAPHRDNALALIEFLLEEESQRMLAAGSYELPVAAPSGFKEDALSAAVIGEVNPLAVRMMDRAGWR